MTHEIIHGDCPEVLPNLFGETPELRSIELLRAHEPPGGYYLAFSGGKDSVALLELAKRAGVAFEAHYHVTTVDPPELVRFIVDHYRGEVTFDKPEITFCQGVIQNGLPMLTGRWCCKKLKERRGHLYVLTGIRAAESASRAKLGVVSPCRRQSRFLINPMVFWTDEDVWGFIRSQGLPYCSLYDEGWKRIGCVPCPFERNVERSMARWPAIWEAVRQAVFRRYPSSVGWQRSFGSPEAVWAWWIRRDRVKAAHPDQTCMAFGVEPE